MKMTAGHFIMKIIKFLIYKTSRYECSVVSAGLTHCQHFLTYIYIILVYCVLNYGVLYKNGNID